MQSCGLFGGGIPAKTLRPQEGFSPAPVQGCGVLARLHAELRIRDWPNFFALKGNLSAWLGIATPPRIFTTPRVVIYSREAAQRGAGSSLRFKKKIKKTGSFV